METFNHSKKYKIRTFLANFFLCFSQTLENKKKKKISFLRRKKIHKIEDKIQKGHHDRKQKTINKNAFALIIKNHKRKLPSCKSEKAIKYEYSEAEKDNFIQKLKQKINDPILNLYKIYKYRNFISDLFCELLYIIKPYLTNQEIIGHQSLVNLLSLFYTFDSLYIFKYNKTDNILYDKTLDKIKYSGSDTKIEIEKYNYYMEDYSFSTYFKILIFLSQEQKEFFPSNLSNMTNQLFTFSEYIVKIIKNYSVEEKNVLIFINYISDLITNLLNLDIVHDLNDENWDKYVNLLGEETEGFDFFLFESVKKLFLTESEAILEKFKRIRILDKMVEKIRRGKRYGLKRLFWMNEILRIKDKFNFDLDFNFKFIKKIVEELNLKSEIAESADFLSDLMTRKFETYDKKEKKLELIDVNLLKNLFLLYFSRFVFCFINYILLNVLKKIYPSLY